MMNLLCLGCFALGFGSELIALKATAYALRFEIVGYAMLMLGVALLGAVLSDMLPIIG